MNLDLYKRKSFSDRIQESDVSSCSWSYFCSLIVGADKIEVLKNSDLIIQIIQSKHKSAPKLYRTDRVNLIAIYLLLYRIDLVEEELSACESQGIPPRDILKSLLREIQYAYLAERVFNSIPYDFLRVQMFYELKIQHAYPFVVGVKTIRDLYEKVFIPFNQREGFTFLDYCWYIESDFLSKLSLTMSDVEFLNSKPYNFISVSSLNKLKIESLDTVMALEKYNLSDFSFSASLANEFTKETFHKLVDKVLASKIKDLQLARILDIISKMPNLNPILDSKELMIKYYKLFYTATIPENFAFKQLFERVFTLKDMLEIITLQEEDGKHE